MDTVYHSCNYNRLYNRCQQVMSKFLDEFGLARVWTNIKNYIDNKIGSSNNVEQEVYSMQETRIGSWINEKPLYRKVIEAITPQTIESISSIANINELNVDKIIYISGWFETREGIQIFFDTADTDENWSARIIRNKNNINCKVTDDNFTNKPCIIIIEYTKTVD